MPTLEKREQKLSTKIGKVRHRIVVKELMENRGSTMGQAIRSAGYSKAYAKNPHMMTATKSFIEVCEENGLTDDFLTKALHDDIKKKPKNRKPELELAFKVKGRLKEHEPSSGNTININIISPEQLARIARRIVSGDSASTQ